jgi:hypothetical protein
MADAGVSMKYHGEVSGLQPKLALCMGVNGSQLHVVCCAACVCRLLAACCLGVASLQFLVGMICACSTVLGGGWVRRSWLATVLQQEKLFGERTGAWGMHAA